MQRNVQSANAVEAELRSGSSGGSSDELLVHCTSDGQNNFMMISELALPSMWHAAVSATDHFNMSSIN